MFAITTTYRHFKTGKTHRYTLKRRYRSRDAAERAARSFAYVCKPDGHTVTGECTASVLEADDAG